MMRIEEFHNALRVLLNIDFHDFEKTFDAAELALHEDGYAIGEWKSFQENPYRYFIRCDDSQAAAIFAIITERTAMTRKRLNIPD